MVCTAQIQTGVSSPGRLRVSKKDVYWRERQRTSLDRVHPNGRESQVQRLSPIKTTEFVDGVVLSVIMSIIRSLLLIRFVF